MNLYAPNKMASKYKGKNRQNFKDKRANAHNFSLYHYDANPSWQNTARGRYMRQELKGRVKNSMISNCEKL